VRMQRRLIRLATGAPNITVVPVLQQWTFDPLGTGFEPGAWLTDEAAVFGVDVYNPWSPDNGREWRTFGSRLDEVVPWTDGRPIAIGEYGCRIDPAHPGRAEAWLRDAVAHARTLPVVSMSYFNSRLNSRHGTWELSGNLERTFGDLLKSDWVARPEAVTAAAPHPRS